jgi:hypothetical protein
LFIVSATIGYYPNGDTNNCILGVVSSIFNEKFPDFAAQPNATSAAEYFAKLLPASGDEVYKKFSQCGKLPTPTQIFGSTIGAIWRALNLTRSFVNTVGTVGETFNYWTYESSFVVCKHSGNIVTCNDNKVELSQAACTKTYPTPGGSPLYSVTVSGNAESSDLRDLMELRFGSRSCFGCHGGGTITCSKGWMGTHLDGGGLGFIPACVRSGTDASTDANLDFSYAGGLTPVSADEMASIPELVTACLFNQVGNHEPICVTKPLVCPS